MGPPCFFPDLNGKVENNLLKMVELWHGSMCLPIDQTTWEVKAVGSLDTGIKNQTGLQSKTSTSTNKELAHN